MHPAHESKLCLWRLPRGLAEQQNSFGDVLDVVDEEGY